MCTPQLDLFDEVTSTPNGDHMKKLCPQEVDVSTTPIEAHKLFGFSSSGVGFFILLMLKGPLDPHCNNDILVNVSIYHISSQR